MMRSRRPPRAGGRSPRRRRRSIPLRASRTAGPSRRANVRRRRYTEGMSIESWVLVVTALLSAGALGLTAWESGQRRKQLRVEFGLDAVNRYLMFQDRFYD